MIDADITNNPGCLGINPAKSIEKRKDGGYYLQLGRANVADRSGKVIERLDDRLFDIYLSRPEHQRVVCLRASGKDSLCGQSVSTTMSSTLDRVCGVIVDIEIKNLIGSVQSIHGVVKPTGRMGVLLKDLVEEDANNVLLFGHRYVGDVAKDKNNTLRFKASNIVGYDLLGSVV